MLPNLNSLREHHHSQMNTLTHLILRHRWEVLQPMTHHKQGCQCQTDTGAHVQGPHQPVAAFEGLNITLGLYKRNYSLTWGKELGAAIG